MATTYPAALDDSSDLPVDIVPGGQGVGTELDGSVPPHSTLHNNLSGAVLALEAKVGIDDSAVTASHDYRIRNLEDPALLLVNGVQYALTRAGVQAAIDAAEAVRGTVRLCGDVTSDGTPIDIDGPLTFDFSGHVLKAPADATAMTGLVTVIGSTSGTAHALTSDASIGDIEVELDTGEGASYDAGDYVFIDQPESEGATKFFAQICQVREVSGDILVLEDALKHDFTQAQFAQVRKWSPIEGVRIVNARFDGNGNTGTTTRAVYLVDARDCVVEAEVTGFNTGAGIIADRGLRNTVRAVAHDSGDGDMGGGDGDGTESDVLLFRQTNYVLDCPFSDSATGFGAQSFAGVMGRWLFPRATGANNRGLKLAHEGFTTMIAPRADASLNSYTGLSITLFSHDVTILGPDGHGNDSYSLMIDACDRVKVIGGRFDTCTVDDIDGPCTEIELLQCSIGTLTNNLAVDAVRIENSVRRDFGDAAGDPTRSGQLQRNGTKLMYHNGSSAIDLTAAAEHGPSAHTDRTVYRPIVPLYNLRGPAALAWAVDTHGSLPGIPHIDVADADANYPKLCAALFPVPDDYVSGGKLNLIWHSPDTAAVARLAAGVREVLPGFAAATTILNEATGSVGLFNAATHGTANALSKQVFVFGTQPTVGRFLEIFWWNEANHANNTASQVSLRGMYFEYTASQ